MLREGGKKKIWYINKVFFFESADKFLNFIQEFMKFGPKGG